MLARCIFRFVVLLPGTELVEIVNLFAVVTQQDRTAWVQVPLALVVLLSPILCLALFVLSLMRRFPDSLRRRFAAAILPVPPVALLLYFAYESGISPLTNIRVDLLLLYPALVVAFLFWPALLLRPLFERH